MAKRRKKSNQDGSRPRTPGSALHKATTKIVPVEPTDIDESVYRVPAPRPYRGTERAVPNSSNKRQRKDTDR